MTNTQFTIDHNPFHHKALGIEDMVPDRHIIRYNIDYGVIGEYTVLSHAHPLDDANLTGVAVGDLIVSVRYTPDGSGSHQSEMLTAYDLGIAPDRAGNFAPGYVVDAADSRFLPEKSMARLRDLQYAFAVARGEIRTKNEPAWAIITQEENDFLDGSTSLVDGLQGK